jgi:hypothetical protein
MDQDRFRQRPSFAPSELEADAARELCVCAFGVGKISCSLETFTGLEQVPGQIRPADLDTEAFDQTIALEYSAAGLPERAPLARARLFGAAYRESKHAVFGSDLVHEPSVARRTLGDIGPHTDRVAGFYANELLPPKREQFQ